LEKTTDFHSVDFKSVHTYSSLFSNCCIIVLPRNFRPRKLRRLLSVQACPVLHCLGGDAYWFWVQLIKQKNYGTPLVNGITQYYAPPDRGDRPAFTPTGQVGTRFTDCVRMKGWVGLVLLVLLLVL